LLVKWLDPFETKNLAGRALIDYSPVV